MPEGNAPETWNPIKLNIRNERETRACTSPTQITEICGTRHITYVTWYVPGTYLFVIYLYFEVIARSETLGIAWHCVALHCLALQWHCVALHSTMAEVEEAPLHSLPSVRTGAIGIDACYDRGAPLFSQHYPSIWELKTFPPKKNRFLEKK